MTRKAGSAERLTEMIRINRDLLELSQSALEDPKLFEPNRFETLLSNRGKMITRLGQLGDALPTRQEGDRTYLTEVDPGEKPAIESLLKELRGLFSTLKGIDRDLRERLLKEKEEAAGDLTRVRQGQQALKRYAPLKHLDGYFIDRRD